jgi:hypothetical protein
MAKHKEAAMSETRSDRLAAGTGILAAALFVAGFVLVGVDAPMSDDTRREVLTTYADDAVNERQALGVMLAVLGGICFLPFLSHVRQLLTRNAGERSILPGTAFAGGVLLVAGVVTGTVVAGAVSAGSYFDAYRVDPDLAMTAVAAGFYLNGFAVMAGGALIAALAIAAYRTRLLPKWLVVLGLIVAAASVPAALLGMWIVIESAWMAIAAGLLARRERAQGATTRVSPAGAGG